MWRPTISSALRLSISGGVSAQLKALVDQLYAFLGKDILKGKKLHLLVAGLSEVPNSGYDLIQKTFEEICAYVGMDLKTLLVATAQSQVKENPETLSKAYEIGQEATLKFSGK